MAVSPIDFKKVSIKSLSEYDKITSFTHRSELRTIYSSLSKYISNIPLYTARYNSKYNSFTSSNYSDLVSTNKKIKSDINDILKIDKKYSSYPSDARLPISDVLKSLQEISNSYSNAISTWNSRKFTSSMPGYNKVVKAKRVVTKVKKAYDKYSAPEPGEILDFIDKTLFPHSHK